MDASDKAVPQTRRYDYNRLGFAIQL
ncbi:MAG: DUF4158 domain-containing protein [Candidatus Obscuribacterales bacterium]|nr:DUF4158 domain-containing protein [Candidatus Obscuribacterales bacterium]